MNDLKTQKRKSRRRRPSAWIGFALILGAVYVTGTQLGNAQDGAAMARAAQAAAAIKPLAHGEMAAFAASDAPKPAPDIAFIDGDGTAKKLSDWRGRTILVNLWATWCTPCKYEMPALDALQKQLGGENFEVVAINLDRGGPEKGKAFYQEIGLEALGFYHDPTGKIFREVKAFGMPTTLLIDANGHELGRLAGPAEWHSDDAKRLIEAAMGKAGGD